MRGIFKFKDGEFSLGGRSKIMGILNVTPDSFSDGAEFLAPDKALEHAESMIRDGAEIIDVGGESSRPGAGAVPSELEISRVIPVIQCIRKKFPSIAISIDTTKSGVAKAALDAGANIINDISGLKKSPGMASLAAEYGAGLVIMHMRGKPSDMQSMTDYGELIPEIIQFLGDAASSAVSCGVSPSSIAIDPGIGFSKNFQQNLEIMRNIESFKSLGYPLLVGPSRKSFVGRVLGRENPRDRLFGTAGAIAWLAMKKIEFLRVHDVQEMLDVVKMIDAISSDHAAVG